MNFKGCCGVPLAEKHDNRPCHPPNDDEWSNRRAYTRSSPNKCCRGEIESHVTNRRHHSPLLSNVFDIRLPYPVLHVSSPPYAVHRQLSLVQVNLSTALLRGRQCYAFVGGPPPTGIFPDILRSSVDTSVGTGILWF